MRQLIISAYILSGAFIAAITVCALVNGYSPMPVIFHLLLLLSSLSLIFVGWRMYERPSNKMNVLAILGAVIMTIYGLSELIVNVQLMTGDKASPTIVTNDMGFGAFNRPCATYDPVRGYRWTHSENRMFKVANGTLVYDNLFQLNAQGYFFNKDYSNNKKDSTRLRYMVLGDSFTSGEYLEKPWPVRFNEIDGAPELYSFSIDGGGLFNWHNIFFNEIVPSYDFDGIILSVFADDLERGFFVMEHLPGEGLTGYLDNIPTDKADLLASYQDQLNPYVSYLSDAGMESEKKKLMDAATDELSHHFQPDVYMLMKMISLPVQFRKNHKFKRFIRKHLVKKGSVDFETAKELLGTNRMNMMKEIINYCQLHDKDIVLATLPYEPVIRHLNKGRILRHYAVCEAICREYDIRYYDSSPLYRVIDQVNDTGYFLPYDIHWSQAGSDHFANGIFEFMQLAAPFN
ncbi:MAG: hypothetical protein GY751_12095 [Bacteroidetes bacterium]|nr:hypothetical protein [Bacteroidota bacterium]